MLTKRSIGISFSDESVNFVELSKRGKEMTLSDFGQKKLPKGAIISGIVKDHEKLVEFLRVLKEQKKVKQAHVSLPESEENLFKDYMKDWEEIFKEAKIKMESSEAEGGAVKRCLLSDKGTYMAVNIGGSFTRIYIYDDGKTVFSSELDAGADTIIEMTEKTVGLSRDMVVSEVSSATVGALSILREEISKSLLYWHTRSKGRQISKIILFGSHAHIKGLDEYLSVSLKTRVETASAWANILDPEKRVPDMTWKESLSYVPALGAALKGVE